MLRRPSRATPDVQVRRRWFRNGRGSAGPARVKVRAKAQLTLPDEIRRALHIGEGDEVEFALHDDGTVTVRGFISIPTDQAWFFTPDWLAGEREADEQIAAGRGRVFQSARGDVRAPGRNPRR